MPIDLSHIFRNRQTELQARLERVRGLPHPTSVGDEGENGWRDVLRDFLPDRYAVDRHRFIIDSNGEVSEQQDIVIFDSLYAPTFLVLGDTHFVPVEAVYAVFEVKPAATSTTIRQAAEKAKSVRRLTMAPGEFGVLIRSTEGDLERDETAAARREPHEIVAGILARSSRYKDPLGESFQRALGEHDGLSTLDIGCVAEGGAFLAVDGEFRRSNQDRSLIAFCVSLFDLLQKVGNATAVDANLYAKDLW